MTWLENKQLLLIDNIREFFGPRKWQKMLKCVSTKHSLVQTMYGFWGCSLVCVSLSMGVQIIIIWIPKDKLTQTKKHPQNPYIVPTQYNYCIELNFINDVDPVLRGLSQTETNINLVINLVAMYTVSVKLLFLHSRG